MEADPVYFMVGDCPAAFSAKNKQTANGKKRFMIKFNGGWGGRSKEWQNRERNADYIMGKMKFWKLL